jgi:hypothetical protein
MSRKKVSLYYYVNVCIKISQFPKCVNFKTFLFKSHLNNKNINYIVSKIHVTIFYSFDWFQTYPYVPMNTYI